VRYQAELEVPSPLRALMAASFVERQERGATAVERFRMEQPIPPYLFALAVGNLEGRDVGPRSRVWAEPEIVDKAAWEFAGVEPMIATAEGLFGPYLWERFDILTMPPSFPYGGMENPRLTFLTPTLLAGDRSLVSVVAHELAHSWTGNLVTNASAEDFWLNEGFTVFAERRILEATEGAEAAALQAALGRRELERTLGELSDKPELQKLHQRLDGVHPDDAFSVVPYEKGYLFLRALEEAAGRERFSTFLRDYVARFRFRSIDSVTFLAFLDESLPGIAARTGAARWLHEPGIPDGAPAPRSSRLAALERLGDAIPDEATARAMSPSEWHLYLESLPRPFDGCAGLEARYRLNESTNYEILVAWLALAAASGFAPAVPVIERALGEVGRMKYLKPLYLALARRADTKDVAAACFRRHKAGYHPIARMVIETVLRSHGVPTSDVNPLPLGSPLGKK
jgi:hypothetical protein